MADYPLNCTWEEVEHSALNPNVFVTMRHINDPDVGEIDVIDMTVSEIYAALQENPNQQFILIDLLKRQCIMTQAPANPNSEAKFSVLDGTTVYIYSLPNGGGRVYTTTEDVSSGSVFPVVFSVVSTDPYTYECSESYEDIETALNADKVVFAKTPSDGIAWCHGVELSDSEISFVSANLNSQTPTFVLYVIDDQDAVTRSVVSMGGGSSDAVLYTPQTLSDSQKEQARTNIDALSPWDASTILQPTQTGDTLAINYTAEQMLTLFGSQQKVYFTVGSLAFFVSAVDTTNGTITFAALNNGMVYEVTMSQTSSTVMSGTLVSYKVNDAVRYGSQTLTTAQKAQARANIGATDGASGISDTIKQELLNCLSYMPWTDANGQQYYDALEAALYSKTVESISAVFTQGSATIYNSDSLDTLRQYLVVTAIYDDTSTSVVTGYELSGTLTVGTSAITVTYGDKTATFNVTVTDDPVYGYVSVGSPSIENNILSPGSSGSIRSKREFSPGNSTWKIRVGFTTGSTINTYQDVAGTVDSSGVSQRGFVLENAWYTQGEHANQALLGAYISSAGSSWDIVAGNVYQQIQANTSYLYELEFTGSQYRARISSNNGDTWSDYISVSATSKVKGGYYIGIGLARNGYFAGTIDLTSVKVWIGDNLWWQAVL